MKKLVTMLSALTITSAIASLTVACNNKEENKTTDKTTQGNKDPDVTDIKGQSVNIDDITSEMIINWKDQYEVIEDDGSTIVKPNQLNTLSKSQIRNIIENNLKTMILTKITGLNESFFSETGPKNPNDLEMKTMFTSLYLHLMPINPDDKNSELLSPFKIEIEESSTVADDKKFAIIITLEKWDEIKDIIQKNIDKNKKEAISLSTKSKEEMKQYIIDEYKERNDGKSPTDEYAEKTAEYRFQLIKATPTINLDSVKTMYDLIQIKDKTKTIEINLNPNIEGVILDLSTITSEMIINWVDEYEWKDYTSGKEITATPDTLKNVNSFDAITNWLRFNIESIIMTKITGLEKPKKTGNVGEPDYIKMNITELKKFVNFYFLINNKVINPGVRHNLEDNKKYIASIEIAKWDEINKDDAFKIAVDKEQSDAKAFLKLNDDAKKAVILKEDPDLEQSEIESMINEKTELSKLSQYLDFDLMKSMYDLIKGKNVSIEIDLNS